MNSDHQSTVVANGYSGVAGQRTMVAHGMNGAGANAQQTTVAPQANQHPPQATGPPAPPKTLLSPQSGPPTPQAGPPKTTVAPAQPTKPPRITASAPVPVRPPAPPKEDRPGWRWPGRGVEDNSTGPESTRREQQPPAAAPPPEPANPLRRHRGRGLTKIGAIVAMVCWSAWLITALFQEPHDIVEPATGLGLMIGGAFLVYWLTRLAGHLLRTTLDRGPRKGTLVPHLFTALLLVLSGLEFLSRTPVSPWKIYTLINNLLV